MVSTLRLPDQLASDARERCARLGISLNALVCVALDAYLGRVAAPEAVLLPSPLVEVPGVPVAAPGASPVLSRKERKRLAAQVYKRA